MTDQPQPIRQPDRPERSRIEDLVGPLYNTSSLQTWLGISQRTLESLVRNGSILALTTADGARVYPAWQWRADKSTVPDLDEVLTLLLSAGADPWTAALWLTSPVDWGDGRALPAWKWLDEDHDPTPVLDQARADAARWVR